MGNSTSSLENKINDQENEIKLLKKKILDSESKTLNLIEQQNRINNLQNQGINAQKEVNQEQDTLINNQNQIIDGVNSRLNSVNSISAVNANKISQWQSEHNKVKQSISSVRQNVDTIRGNVSTVTDNLALLRNNVNDNTTNILSNTGNILLNTNNIDKNRLTGTAIQGQISDLTGNLSEINRNHNIMRDQINTNADNIETNTPLIEENRGGILNVVNAIQNVSDSVAENRVSISAVEGQISGAVNNNVQNDSSQSRVRIHPLFGAFEFMDNQTTNIGNTVLTIGLNPLVPRKEVMISICNNEVRRSQGEAVNTLQFGVNVGLIEGAFLIDGINYEYSTRAIKDPDGNKYNDFFTMRLAVREDGRLIDHYMMALSIIDNDNEDLFIYRQYLPDNNSIPDELTQQNIVGTVNKLKLRATGPQIISKREVVPGDVVTYIATRLNTPPGTIINTCSDLN